MTTIYGWTEQNGASYGVQAVDVDGSVREHIMDAETGELNGYAISHETENGRWFTTFAAAKRAALRFWEDRWLEARTAMREIRGQRKADL